MLQKISLSLVSNICLGIVSEILLRFQTIYTKYDWLLVKWFTLDLVLKQSNQKKKGKMHQWVILFSTPWRTGIDEYCQAIQAN